MRAGAFLSDLLFPPRCVSCRRFLKRSLLDPCEAPLCEKCRLAWEKEKTEVCARCGSELLLCRCGSERMAESGIEGVIKLVYYRRAKDSIGRRIILYLKTRRNKRAFRFLAAQLSYPLRKVIEERFLKPENVCLCFVPRSFHSEDAYGLDQANLLCHALGEHMSIRALPLFYRIARDRKEQKHLSASERRKNARLQFAVNETLLKDALQNVKLVCIVDDVVTTGSSMAACAACLRPFYKGAILGISVARSPLAREKSVAKKSD